MTGSVQQSMFGPEREYEPVLYWLWLAGVLGPGSARAGCVLDAFGGAREAWEARGTSAFRLAAGAAAAKRACDDSCGPESFGPLAARCAAIGVRILPFDDADYPLAFSRIADMPLVIYCTGSAAWLNEPGAVGIVGSRSPTDYGQQAAAGIGKELAENGAVIVSGLADGLDSAAHRAALAAGRPTIAVLGVPIDRTYPAANVGLRRKIEQNGCVISEYAPLTEPIGRNGFLQRNRLIAALSSALLVVEAREKSGTMSTVAHAERYSKPVFAVPGSIFSQNSAGTNRLIGSGRAKAACCAGDMFGALGLTAGSKQAAACPPRPPAPVSEDERRVLSCIGATPRGVEEIAARSGLPAAVLLGALMKLELTGRVLCQPGKQYVLR